MNRKSVVLVIGLGGLFVAACAGTKLRPEAAKVQVVSETDKPLHCKTLGSIMGKASADTEKEAHEKAMNVFRNEAATRKANYAMVTQENGGPMGTTGSLQSAIVGKALICTDADSEPADGGAP